MYVRSRLLYVFLAYSVNAIFLPKRISSCLAYYSRPEIEKNCARSSYFFWSLIWKKNCTLIIGSALCVIFMILVLHFFCFCTFENVEKCVLGGCMITSKTKINVFWNFFFAPLAPSGPLHSKKISKNVDFSLWGNCATPQTHIWNWNFFRALTHCAWCYY